MKYANRLVKLQNYVRRSESRQPLDLEGVFSLRFNSREPAGLKRTSFYRSSDFISDSMRSLRTVSLQRWGWKWVVVPVVSYLNDLLDSYVQEQLTLSHSIVISAGPGKERTPNGQVSKWESLSEVCRSDLCEGDNSSTEFPPIYFIYNHWPSNEKGIGWGPRAGSRGQGARGQCGRVFRLAVPLWLLAGSVCW